jgi:23S rRNA pseudouridine2605 synthase
MSMRLNQFLAQAIGVSRRGADTLIAEGQVKVNGKRAEVGQVVHSVLDKIEHKGQVCHLAKRQYIMLNKPKGLISTRKDPQQRKTIYDILPPEYADLRSAGRLDRNTTGLLILSNDGDFLNQLIHPRHQWAKKYRVIVDKPIKSAALMGLQNGVMLQPENKKAVLSVVEQRDEVTVVVSTKTGYYRQIRRMFELEGYEVLDLKRLSIGPIEMRGLKPGETRPLTLSERNTILKTVATKLKSKASRQTPSRSTKPSKNAVPRTSTRSGVPKVPKK